MVTDLFGSVDLMYSRVFYYLDCWPVHELHFCVGCFNQLDTEQLLAAVNLKSVLVRGTLSAIVIVAITWMKKRP
jgi:hypothetical protein